MNLRGTPQNLRAAHWGNTNAQKAGTHSRRALTEREHEVRRSLQLRPFGEVCRDFRLDDLCSMLALRAALKDDLTTFGLTNRQRELRRQVGTFLRVSRRIGECLARVEEDIAARDLTESGENPPDSGSTPRGVALILELHRIAYGEAADVTPAQQVRAIAELLSMPRPPEPNPVKKLSDAKLDGGLAAHLRGEPIPDYECDLSDPVWWIDNREAQAKRCVDVLYAIATGTRPDVRREDQFAAMRLIRRVAPQSFGEDGFDIDDDELMSDEELERYLRERGALGTPDDPQSAPESDQRRWVRTKMSPAAVWINASFTAPSTRPAVTQMM